MFLRHDHGIYVLDYYCTVPVYAEHSAACNISCHGTFCYWYDSDFTGLCIRNYQKSHSRYILWTMISFLILAAGAVLSIVQFYIVETEDNSFYFRTAFVIFLIVMINSNVKSIKSFTDKRAFGHYKRLACIDPVTGGNTRMFFAEKNQGISCYKPLFSAYESVTVQGYQSGTGKDSM